MHLLAGLPASVSVPIQPVGLAQICSLLCCWMQRIVVGPEYFHAMVRDIRSLVFRELEEFIFGQCEPDAQAALLATIAAGQEHVLTLLPEGI